LGNGYRLGLSLDRIDVNGNYQPDNCQWITRSENSKRVRASYKMTRRDKFDLDRYLPIEVMYGSP
jgi:hypothetical protein